MVVVVVVVVVDAVDEVDEEVRVDEEVGVDEEVVGMMEEGSVRASASVTQTEPFITSGTWFDELP